MSLSDRQLRAIHAKGTLPMRAYHKHEKPLSRSGYDVEKLEGSDVLVIRKKGETRGTLTTKEDLSRAIKNLQTQQKLKEMIEKKMEATKRRSKFTDQQLRQIGKMQKELVE